MSTLKNAMNAGTRLLNQHGDERLVLVTKWTNTYQHFDGLLRHLDGTGHEIAVIASTGLFDTFTAVHEYAQAHGFADDWQVQEAPAAEMVAPALGSER